MLHNHQNIDNLKNQKLWFDLISEETHQHSLYLQSIGLSDRAKCFKVNEFTVPASIPESIDISKFNGKMSLPEDVKAFDPKEKNTLFTTLDSKIEEQQNAIKQILDIRLYPTIQKFIKKHETTVFLGLLSELCVFTESKNEKIFIEIETPSSVKFYIAMKGVDLKIYIAGLVSHENLIQQLMTLKLANIDLNNISILGNTEHFPLICKNDLLEFKKQASHYLAKKNVLIVAGCQLEETACTALNTIFSATSTCTNFLERLYH